jgi:hypothetical protein
LQLGRGLNPSAEAADRLTEGVGQRRICQGGCLGSN